MKKTIKIVAIGALLLLAGVNFFYPYSIFSMNKSVSYSGDRYLIADYKKNLKKFKQHHNKQPKKERVAIKTEYILQTFEQDWLLSTKRAKIKMFELEGMLVGVKETRHILMEFSSYEKFSMETRMFLNTAIESCIEIEVILVEIMNSESESRKTLKGLLRNLHGSYLRSFDAFVTFYDASEAERQK
ncbi:hypothetical protein [Mesobacillus zeae]|uniref:Uncharacterized protein n=1 Tax=Mesobacillus zeae TaxID=1917180 RepID=A0A398AWG2_9BACI|nr:hypothetical protein [Mesobacillus zeae]RID81931.1 hypothetical protein D1970_20390 [Mesobacillus zeae]